AQINRDQYGLKVKVVSLDEVYHEFSSGNPDVGAIRNMVRYIYDNVDDPDQKIKYLCLFGDASYDYKDRISNNTNVVPSWHSYNSFSLSGSFVADDFFGMMDPNEGTMIPSDRLDLAVGRILADTPQRAKEMVDKIKDYYAPASYGSWRNNFITISDDVDESWETILQSTTDEIGNIVTADKPFVNVTKIHSDSYQQESTAGGQRYPDVNKAIFDAMEVGALVVNYFGHGGEDGLARERIWDKNNVQEINNVCKLPLFVTVTCEYTKFDNPNRPTAGEFLYWNKDAGAIGLITTTRQIFVSVGVAMNIILKNYLFALGSNDYPSMAEALRLTKNDPGISSIEQRRLIFFIGDPAMKLAFPKPDVRLTRVNDVPVSDQIQTLEALGYAKIDGEVIDEGGNVLTDYNGVLTATIYDKEIERSTLANDGTTEGGQLIVLDYTTLGEVIFRGQASVTNGQFSFDFIVPRDIGIPVGNGKVSFYSKNEAPLQNQAGASFEIQIGGLNENAAEDNEGPAISLFMNDESFVSGGITNQEPTLLAKLSDENGINTSSGIGHDIVAILDGDETNPFKLNDYYVANVDDYTKGALSYPFRDLEPGLHTLTLKAWDVYNNSSTSEIQFVVFDENEELVIRNVLNYPNPFVNYTEFWFNHNSSEVLDVSIQIFTVSGKLVKTINGQTSGGSKNTSSVSRDLVWDGLDDFGDRIGKGVYVYKLSVHSPLLNKTVEKFQKLVIL
ncbi:MAG: type IX secretion system sortase PorU, partial [Bacteroidia bacterium]|nr:type IX secretion system sortase PorU [Bacteroidia bacterium]